MNFIIRVLEGNAKQKDYQTISVHIPERLAEAIQCIVGFSVADMRNLARIGYVINNLEHIRAGKNRSKYKNADGTLAKTVEIQKRIGTDFYYVVEAVPNTDIKKLRVVSAFINRNDTFFEVAISNNPSRYVLDEPQSNASSSRTIISDYNKYTTDFTNKQ